MQCILVKCDEFKNSHPILYTSFLLHPDYIAARSARSDRCAAISANSERLKNHSTTGVCTRPCLLLVLPRFDTFVLVMRIIQNLLYPPIKAVVDRYCIRIVVGANEKSYCSLLICNAIVSKIMVMSRELFE